MTTICAELLINRHPIHRFFHIRITVFHAEKPIKVGSISFTQNRRRQYAELAIKDQAIHAESVIDLRTTNAESAIHTDTYIYKFPVIWAAPTALGRQGAQ